VFNQADCLGMAVRLEYLSNKKLKKEMILNLKGTKGVNDKKDEKGTK